MQVQYDGFGGFYQIKIFAQLCRIWVVDQDISVAPIVNLKWYFDTNFTFNKFHDSSVLKIALGHIVISVKFQFSPSRSLFDMHTTLE